MFNKISNYSVIVTGGSKGIGKGIAAAFAKQGANVVIAARDVNAAKSTLKELQQYAGQVKFFRCDVSEWQSVSELVEYTLENFNRLDVMCANAGSYPMNPIEKMSSEEWDNIIENGYVRVKCC